MGKPPWKNVNFSTFWTSWFYSLERRFFVVKYGKRYFPALYCLKKRSWINCHFWIKSMGQPLWKNVNFSSFWTSCFYSLERPFFFLEYHKRHFLAYIALRKKVRKMAKFGPKPWLNPFKKMLIFRLFELFIFIA